MLRPNPSTPSTVLHEDCEQDGAIDHVNPFTPTQRKGDDEETAKSHQLVQCQK